MADVVSKEVRSQIMRQVQSKNTTPEISVRKQLHAAGFRYRLHVKQLSGTPDIVLPRHRTVVFVHGCLWHWHGCKRSRMPSSNKLYWTTKIERNVERDEHQIKFLRQDGWHVEIIWECEATQGVEKLIKYLRSSTAEKISNLAV